MISNRFDSLSVQSLEIVINQAPHNQTRQSSLLFFVAILIVFISSLAFGVYFSRPIISSINYASESSTSVNVQSTAAAPGTWDGKFHDFHSHVGTNSMICRKL